MLAFDMDLSIDFMVKQACIFHGEKKKSTFHTSIKRD